MNQSIGQSTNYLNLGLRIITSNHLIETKIIDRKLTRFDKFKLYINSLCDKAEIYQPKWSKDVKTYDTVTAPMMKMVQMGDTIYIHPLLFDKLKRHPIPQLKLVDYGQSIIY